MTNTIDPRRPIGACHEDLQKMLEGKLDPEVIAALPEASRIAPIGHWMVVVRERTPEKIGSIHVPTTAREHLACGWVIAVGPDVGREASKWPGGWWGSPQDLLGRKVLFAMYAGSGIMLTERDRAAECDFVIMTDSDIKATIEETTNRVVAPAGEEG